MLGISLLVAFLALAVLITYLAYTGATEARMEVHVDYDVGAIIGGTLAGSGVLIASIAYSIGRLRD
jgi:hypothetical protein